MARTRSPTDQASPARLVINAESAGLTHEQFFRLFYRTNTPAICLDQPGSVSADPELPGLILNLTEIWA